MARERRVSHFHRPKLFENLGTIINYYFNEYNVKNNYLETD